MIDNVLHVLDIALMKNNFNVSIDDVHNNRLYVIAQGQL